jgi:hypothetical protein
LRNSCAMSRRSIRSNRRCRILARQKPWPCPGRRVEA